MDLGDDSYDDEDDESFGGKDEEEGSGSDSEEGEADMEDEIDDEPDKKELANLKGNKTFDKAEKRKKK